MPEEVEKHPSYGAIRISRPSGGDGKLLMSPLRHPHHVSITISEAELVRESLVDRHHAGKELVTIDMSDSPITYPGSSR